MAEEPHTAKPPGSNAIVLYVFLVDGQLGRIRIWGGIVRARSPSAIEIRKFPPIPVTLVLCAAL